MNTRGKLVQAESCSRIGLIGLHGGYGPSWGTFAGLEA